MMAFGIALLIFASAQATPGAAPSAPEESLKRFLRTIDADRSTRYIARLRNLNQNRGPEAIVYMIGEKWCGSGGCDTLILIPEAGSWKILADITITRLPIYVSTGTFRGWHSIGVWVQGGGIQPGYEAELRFNGNTYPENPTVRPAANRGGTGRRSGYRFNAGRKASL
jgi:hypothetical protein